MSDFITRLELARSLRLVRRHTLSAALMVAADEHDPTEKESLVKSFTDQDVELVKLIKELGGVIDGSD